MKMYDIIAKKRDKKLLSKEEIEFFVKGYVDKKIPDYQVSSLLMAIYLNGMNDKEIFYLTDSFIKSGNIIDLSKINGFKLDKHSTGGVGDKTTFIVVPILASLGCKIVKMSGKGLGHTGGTADKINAIPNICNVLTNNEIINNVNNVGACLITQSENITPADKLIYALRDVTATVESIPLIASSIMSKKIASGADGILLDVKVGSGAFMKNIKDATKLANKMVEIGKYFNKKMTAMITDMSNPLGNNIGNSLEIIESIDVLKNNGPKDLTELCIEMATQMYMMSNNKSYETCKKEVIKVLENGTALEKFKEIVKMQQGDIKIFDNYDLLPKSKYSYDILANKDGFISSIKCDLIGTCSSLIGAGRITKEDTIDYGAGIILHKKVNDYVKKGDKLATFYTNNNNIEEIKKLFLSAYKYSDSKENDNKLIIDIIR